MTVRGPKRGYGVDGRAGCVSLRRSRETGTMVGVYAADEAGMECDPELPWATVCEEHSAIVCHPTLRLARDHAALPSGWCEDCRDLTSPEVVAAADVAIVPPRAEDAA